MISWVGKCKQMETVAQQLSAEILILYIEKETKAEETSLYEKVLRETQSTQTGGNLAHSPWDSGVEH